MRQVIEGKPLAAPTELSVRIRLTHAKQQESTREINDNDGDGFFFAKSEADSGPKADEDDLL
mgnify:CR=1 FL=1